MVVVKSNNVSKNFFFFFFWPCHTACGNLVPDQGLNADRENENMRSKSTELPADTLQ